MTTLSYRPSFPPGTRVIDATAHLRPGYRITLTRSGFIAVRRNNRPQPKPAA